jgi:ABC-type branched-subunit amino acid transport system substrate-binding protein
MDTQKLKTAKSGTSVRRHWRLWVTILLFAIVGGLMVGGQALAQPSDRQAGPAVLKIGYIGQPGSDMARGVSLAIRQINESGGASGPDNTLYTFELVVAGVLPGDAASVPGALQMLSNQGVVAIFGPDDDALALPNLAGLSAASAPILTGATSATLYNQDAAGNLFRIVAPENVYSEALADYMVRALSLQNAVLIQTELAWTEGVISFSNAFSRQGGSLLSTIQLTDNAELLNNIRTLPELNPDAVVMYGPANDAFTVLNQLRANNWDGTFVYRSAQQALASGNFSSETAVGVLGVDSWTFGANDSLGTIFVAQYVAQYGAVPGPLSVAGYDSFFALSQIVSRFGATSAQIRQGLPQLRPLNLVRGPLSPGLSERRDLSRTALIYELTGQGGAQAIAAFDDGVQRVAAGFGEETAAALPTPTLAAQVTATQLPTAIPTIVFPTPTPNAVMATVTQDTLNVRTGPGTNYDRIGQLRRNDQVPVIGRNSDFTWLVIQFRGQVAWIAAQFVTLFDPGGQQALLPIVQPPASPTPAPTQVQAEPDLVITNVTLSTPQILTSVQFSATVFIANQGGSDAGPFAVASTFLPDGNYVAQNLPGLAKGQSTTAVLTTTLTQTGNVSNLAVVLDLNSQVNEGAAGETNNIFTISYKVDRSLKLETQSTLNAPANVDLSVNTINDLSWDGVNLTTLNGALIGVFVGETYQTAHRDLAATVATSGALNNPQIGAVVAFRSDEGLFGVIRIDNRIGNALTITYRIYNP